MNIVDYGFSSSEDEEEDANAPVIAVKDKFAPPAMAPSESSTSITQQQNDTSNLSGSSGQTPSSLNSFQSPKTTQATNLLFEYDSSDEEEENSPSQFDLKTSTSSQMEEAVPIPLPKTIQIPSSPPTRPNLKTQEKIAKWVKEIRSGGMPPFNISISKNDQFLNPLLLEMTCKDYPGIEQHSTSFTNHYKDTLQKLRDKQHSYETLRQKQKKLVQTNSSRKEKNRKRKFDEAENRRIRRAKSSAVPGERAFYNHLKRMNSAPNLDSAARNFEKLRVKKVKL